ncbi:MAG: hydroxyacid dehydrogenase [Chloroflexi bacterium]|nr:hydroxyacid dehydrogenase [Chloroflexota bacterium]MBT4515818.1 hydroxyacid dehydrogenase [Chloroflexota bacterium]MBT6680431.1 hydroxyacid dehydrogenase [Chloroflexota bacterium]
MKSAIFYDYPPADGDVFGQGRRERIAGLTDLYPHVMNGANFQDHAASLSDTDVIFATWGMPRFTEHHFASMPKLRAVFYAAGNVKSFAAPLVEHDITLVSAWGINAIPVSEMCLSQVLLSLRGYFRAVRNYRSVKTHDAKVFPRTGAMDETVGLIGLGKIGARLRYLLSDYPVKVIAYDPFLTPERVKELHVELVSLQDVFERSLVVSNHTPDIPSTQGVLTGEHFGAMRDGATFINTGRGAQVVEDDLVQVLSERPDMTVLLDVTAPEPPPEDSKLWTLPNVIISPHVGGTIGNEVVRLADCVIDEYERWAAGRTLKFEVTSEVLATMG